MEKPLARIFAQTATGRMTKKSDKHIKRQEQRFLMLCHSKRGSMAYTDASASWRTRFIKQNPLTPFGYLNVFDWLELRLTTGGWLPKTTKLARAGKGTPGKNGWREFLTCAVYTIAESKDLCTLYNTLMPWDGVERDWGRVDVAIGGS
jgi:hypothetical protein